MTDQAQTTTSMQFATEMLASPLGSGFTRFILRVCLETVYQRASLRSSKMAEAA
jgi:hypothetical protein